LLQVPDALVCARSGDRVESRPYCPLCNRSAFALNPEDLCSKALFSSAVDVALVGVREPRYVELNNAISDDVASRIDLAQLHNRYVG
jgi:hypothetical protein